MKKLFFLPLFLHVVSIYITAVIFFRVKDISYPIGISITLSAIFYILSIVAIFFIQKSPDSHRIFINMTLIAKVLLIPFYVINYIFGFLMGISSIANPLGPFFVFAIVIIDIIPFILTSLYASIGIFKMANHCREKNTKWLIITQWVFCVDVIALLVIWILSKRADKLLSSQK